MHGKSHLDESQAAGAPPSLSQLFLVFCGITLSGFGGVLPFARRTLVEQRRWMTPEEFNDAFALCQMLPGPNIVNMAVVFGSRLHGLTGGLVAFLGFLGPPFVIVIAVASLYANVNDNAALQRVMTGISAAGVGLFAATVMKMAAPLVRQRSALALSVVAGVFVAVGLLRLPMPLVLAVMIPLNIFLVWKWR
ncbi:MAG: chromate transporter [Xanthobacteraceae bacterium]|nr:MAG: chromate transporter [Xanthobacteraceae bacterium]